MLNKTQLKKLINKAGKDGRLIWAYKDGIHYMSDSFFMLKANEKVFDSELVGLMYKYFNMKPKSGDKVYRNKVEEKYDEFTRKKKPVYSAAELENKDIFFFIENLRIADIFALVEFLNIYVHFSDNDAALYGEFNKERNTVVAINRYFHELIAWHDPKIHVPNTQYYRGKNRGIIFHDVDTDTKLLVLPCRIGRPKILSDRYVMENE